MFQNMIKLSKKTHFNFFIALAMFFGVIVTLQIIEYNPEGGSLFSQFRISLLGLSLTIVQLFNYLKALKEEK